MNFQFKFFLLDFSQKKLKQKTKKIERAREKRQSSSRKSKIIEYFN